MSAGWCSGVGPQPPHWTERLVNSDPPLCGPCWARWHNHDDHEEDTP